MQLDSRRGRLHHHCGPRYRLHTIAWGVTDSAGRADGIGSRYFTVLGLAPGDYDVMVYAWNHRTARWEDARTVRVTVR
jgi:hypothetical protein